MAVVVASAAARETERERDRERQREREREKCTHIESKGDAFTSETHRQTVKQSNWTNEIAAY
jgi:hypothetical protein